MSERPLYVRQLEERIAERVRLLKIEQRPIMQELSKLGIYMLKANEAVLDKEQFRIAAPIFMRHLKSQKYSQLTLEILAGTFDRKDASDYWDDLVEIYLSQPETKPEGYGDLTMALTAALSTLATTKHIPAIVDMLRDSRLRDRVLLLSPLRRRRRDPKIAAIIEELRKDPYFSKEINSWRPLK